MDCSEAWRRWMGCGKKMEPGGRFRDVLIHTIADKMTLDAGRYRLKSGVAAIPLGAVPQGRQSLI